MTAYEMAIEMNLTPEQAAKIDRLAMVTAAATGESKEYVLGAILAFIRQCPKSGPSKHNNLTRL